MTKKAAAKAATTARPVSALSGDGLEMKLKEFSKVVNRLMQEHGPDAKIRIKGPMSCEVTRAGE